MNIVIPMAGEGQRFRDAGYQEPKPLIDVAGKPMIRRVMDCLAPSEGADFYLISRLNAELGANTILLDHPTRGAVETILEAEDVIVDHEPVMVANCDQLITADIDHFLLDVAPYDVGIVTFNSTNPHHSYVTTDEAGLVTSIKEKQVISDQALAGIYWFSTAMYLFVGAKIAIKEDRRVNGEFYISSALEVLLDDGLRIKAWEIDVHEKHMLGTPEELRIFLDKVDAGRVTL